MIIQYEFDHHANFNNVETLLLFRKGRKVDQLKAFYGYHLPHRK